MAESGRSGECVMWTRESIYDLKRESGLSIPELIVLRSSSDPFLLTKAHIKGAEWFAKIWERGGFKPGTHLRRIHYWCVSQTVYLWDGVGGGKPGRPTSHTGKKMRYRNTLDHSTHLSDASSWARYLGLVDPQYIDDHRNPDPIIQEQDESWSSYWVDVPPRTPTACARVTAAQPYHLEVWVEKSTMDDVLKPICDRYQAHLVRFLGQSSITSCHRLAVRSWQAWDARKPVRIFYISDFDPAGQNMPLAASRKIEYFVRNKLDFLDVKLLPIALTAEQAEHYRLPRIPIKEGDTAKKAFEAVHGGGATELDALEAIHPGVLGEILETALDPYWNQSVIDEAEDLERKVQSRLKRKMAAILRKPKYKKAMATMGEMNKELAALSIRCEDPPEAESDADDSKHEWLLDTTRDYLDQLNFYRAHKNGG